MEILTPYSTLSPNTHTFCGETFRCVDTEPIISIISSEDVEVRDICTVMGDDGNGTQ